MHYVIMYAGCFLLTKTVSVRLKSEELEELSDVSDEWKTDRSEAMRRLLSKALQEWKTKKALKDLQEHKISIGLAAKKTGLNLWKILDLVKEKNINWTGYNQEDLKKDLKAMDEKK